MNIKTHNFIFKTAGILMLVAGCSGGETLGTVEQRALAPVEAPTGYEDAEGPDRGGLTCDDNKLWFDGRCRTRSFFERWASADEAMLAVFGCEARTDDCPGVIWVETHGTGGFRMVIVQDAPATDGALAIAAPQIGGYLTAGEIIQVNGVTDDGAAFSQSLRYESTLQSGESKSTLIELAERNVSTSLRHRS